MGKYTAVLKSAAYAVGTVAALGVSGYAGLNGMPLLEGAALLGGMGTLTGTLMKAVIGDSVKNSAAKVSPGGMVRQSGLAKGIKLRDADRREQLNAFYAETMNVALGLNPKNVFGRSIQYKMRTHDSILKVFDGLKKLGMIENITIKPRKKQTRLVAEKIMAGTAKLSDLFKGKKHYQVMFPQKTMYDVKFTVNPERVSIEEYKSRAEGDKMAMRIIESLEKSKYYSPVHKSGKLDCFALAVPKVERKKTVRRINVMRTKDKIAPFKGNVLKTNDRRVDILPKR